MTEHKRFTRLAVPITGKHNTGYFPFHMIQPYYDNDIISNDIANASSAILLRIITQQQFNELAPELKIMLFSGATSKDNLIKYNGLLDNATGVEMSTVSKPLEVHVHIHTGNGIAECDIRSFKGSISDSITRFIAESISKIFDTIRLYKYLKLNKRLDGECNIVQTSRFELADTLLKIITTFKIKVIVKDIVLIITNSTDIDADSDKWLEYFLKLTSKVSKLSLRIDEPLTGDFKESSNIVKKIAARIIATGKLSSKALDDSAGTFTEYDILSDCEDKKLVRRIYLAGV